MLRKTLAARLFAARRGFGNPIMEGVHFSALDSNTVRAVATNSHILAIVDETVPDVTDAPAKAKAGMDFEPFLIQAEDCQEIETLRKKTARGTSLPVLDFAFINTAKAKDNGTVPIIVTNLDKTVMIRVPKIDGQFPNWKKVIPSEKPTFHTAFNPDYLIKVCQLAKAIGAVRVDLRIFDQPGAVDSKEQPQPKKMVMFDAAGDDVTAKMLVMPVMVDK